jgi:hypothetical protein
VIGHNVGLEVIVGTYRCDFRPDAISDSSSPRGDKATFVDLHQGHFGGVIVICECDGMSENQEFLVMIRNSILRIMMAAGEHAAASQAQRDSS